MMQLRNIFNENRFAGCVNARADWVCFAVDAERPLALVVVETPDGGARLMAREGGAPVAPESLGLPEYVLGRICLWNSWASAALEYEYEQEFSLYGLEAYAISIAVEVARAFPDRPVSYCGLRVHDEFALYQYAARRVFEKNGWPADLPLIPLEDQCNRYMTRLKKESLRTPPIMPPETYVLHWYWDWGPYYFFFDVAESSLFDEGDKVEISSQDGFPDWLVDQANRMDELWGASPFSEWQSLNSPQSYWKPSPLLDHFCTDALSVDVARYIKPRVPVSCSSRYVTGMDVLPFCKP